jgi:hypothetical protein
MAIGSRVVVLFESAKNTFVASKDLELIFKSVSVSADGIDNGMNITEVSGEFDFNAKNITNVGTVDGVDISAHASRHISAGADEIDGDQLDIDWNPTNYTPTTSPTEVTSLDHLTAHLAGIDAALAAAADEQVKVSANDTTQKYLEDAIVSANTTNTTLPIELTTLNDGADEDLQIGFDVSKVDHDSTLNFVADEHVAHTGVSVIAATAGLSATNNDLSSNIGLALDITSLTDLTTIADADTIAVYDADAAGHREITRANFIGSAGFTMAAEIAMGTNKITGLADGTSATDAINKGQLDAVIAGIDLKEEVRVATTGPLPAVTASGTGVGKTLTADAVGVVTIDGEDLTTANGFATGDRIMVKNQAAPVDNGLYTITQLSAAGTALILTRATDADENAEVTKGMFTFVKEGTINANTGWAVITSDPITVDTTGIVWSQFQGLPAYTASLGVEIVGVDFRLDLLASGGLKLTGNEVGVEPADFAGDGLEDDGSDNLRLDLKASGGLKFDTGEVAVEPADFAGTGLEDDGADNLQLDLLASGGLKFTGNEVGVEPADFAGAGLEDDGSDNLRIAASAAGDGLQGGGGSALAVDYTEQITNNSGGTISANQLVYVNASGEIVLADADTAASNTFALGYTAEEITNTSTGAVYMRMGARMSGFTGLTPGAKVYVSATAGGYTQTAPSGAGQHVYCLGRAISASEVMYLPDHEGQYA